MSLDRRAVLLGLLAVAAGCRSERARRARGAPPPGPSDDPLPPPDATHYERLGGPRCFFALPTEARNLGAACARAVPQRTVAELSRTLFGVDTPPPAREALPRVAQAMLAQQAAGALRDVEGWWLTDVEVQVMALAFLVGCRPEGAGPDAVKGDDPEEGGDLPDDSPEHEPPTEEAPGG